MIEAENRVLVGLATETTRQQSDGGKLAMEIRGLRVPLVEPRPPLVSRRTTELKKLYYAVF